jgi:hypothetical protein
MSAWTCDCSEGSYFLKIEADFSCDPTWCEKCGASIDLDELPLSPSLKKELVKWVLDYGKWIDTESDSLLENGIQLEEEHNSRGLLLRGEIINELGGRFSITFTPSSLAQIYKFK